MLRQERPRCLLCTCWPRMIDEPHGVSTPRGSQDQFSYVFSQGDWMRFCPPCDIKASPPPLTICYIVCASTEYHIDDCDSEDYCSQSQSQLYSQEMGAKPILCDYWHSCTMDIDANGNNTNHLLRWRWCSWFPFTSSFRYEPIWKRCCFHFCTNKEANPLRGICICVCVSGACGIPIYFRLIHVSGTKITTCYHRLHFWKRKMHIRYV